MTILIFIKNKVCNVKNKMCNKPKQCIPNISGSRVLKGKEKEGIKEYLEDLDFAISNKNIFNVALSGGYGTGKSSIIKTYLHDKF